MIITEEADLKYKCKDVSLFEAPAIIKELERELQNTGIGLAANQIGIDAKVCIIRASGTERLDLVNPVITKKYDLMEFYNEGCLSFPDRWILTKRFAEIVVKDALRPAGVILTGLSAVVTQHEVGHLYGETMFDYEIKRPAVNEKCWCGSNRKYKKCHEGKRVI